MLQVHRAEPPPKGTRLVGHGGADFFLIDAFVRTVAGEGNFILSGPDETLESHLMVFAAEQARHKGSVVALGDGTPLAERDYSW